MDYELFHTGNLCPNGLSRNPRNDTFSIAGRGFFVKSRGVRNARFLQGWDENAEMRPHSGAGKKRA